MKTANWFVLAILFFGIVSSGACLYSIEIQNPALDSLACPLLGPGIIGALAGALLAVLMLSIGVALHMMNNSEGHLPRMYLVNAVVAMAIPLTLMI